MPDWILNSKVLVIIATLICVASIIAFVLGYAGESVMLTILGFAGFGGVAAFRDWIDSQGWKTYLVAGVGILGTIGLVTNFITAEVFIALLTLLGVGSAGTLAHAANKVPVGVRKLKRISVSG